MTFFFFRTFAGIPAQSNITRRRIKV